MSVANQNLCVIVSHYNARPTDELVRLLRQLKNQVAKFRSVFSTAIIIVVNDAESKPITLPSDIEDIEVQYRENTGFNIGSWEYGWRKNTNFYGYLFLQDECEVAHPNALLNYWLLLRKRPNSLIGESLFFFRGWKGFLNEWPLNHTSIQDFALSKNIPLGLSASHLQTLILASTREAMLKLDGFILSDDKIEAIATEVLLSRKAVSLGITVEQSAWMPFSNFSHEQWAGIKQKSHSIAWNISKLLWHLTYGWRDLSVRLKP